MGQVLKLDPFILKFCKIFLFLICKIKNSMIEILIFIVCLIYFAFAIYYSIGVDKTVYYHPERIERDPKKYVRFYVLRCFFWIFFIRKLNRLIKN